MRRSSWSPCPRAACRATASTCAWSLVRARRVRVACTGLAAVAPSALSDARACRVCVAGKTVTVVVPDELQPGQVLAVRPRPVLPPLASAPHPPAAAVMGGPPCSHPHPCPALRLPPEREERLHLLCSLCSLCLLFSGHCAAQAQGEAERHRSAAEGISGAGRRSAAAAAPEPRLGGRRRAGGVRRRGQTGICGVHDCISPLINLP